MTFLEKGLQQQYNAIQQNNKPRIMSGLVVATTPLFSEGLTLKLDETLNTLWGVKEDPHGTPKSQRKRYFTENFLLPISIRI